MAATAEAAQSAALTQKISASAQASADASASSRKSKKLAAGAASGILSALVFQPLDVLRTKQQGAFGFEEKGPSTLQSLEKVRHWNMDNLRSMWRGTSPTLVRVAGGAGLYFASLDHFLNVLPPSAVATFAAGGFARTFASCVVSPVTIIKARIEWQSSQGMPTSLSQLPLGGNKLFNKAAQRSKSIGVLQQILHSEGVKGLYRGIVPTLVRDVPFSGLYVLLYTRLKEIASEKFPDMHATGMQFSSGVIAGVFATSLVHPADVVKTRMQLSMVQRGAHGDMRVVSNSLSLQETISKILSEEGMKGFARGIVPRVIKRTLSTALAWTIYERLSVR